MKIIQIIGVLGFLYISPYTEPLVKNSSWYVIWRKHKKDSKLIHSPH